MDSLFIEGSIRAPLSSLEPQDQSLLPTEDLATLLRGKHSITCLLSLDARDSLQRALGLSGAELRAVSTPPFIENHKILCSHSTETLQRAKQVLGSAFVCDIDLYCVPPNTKKSCDGDVFRSIRYHMARPDRPKCIAVAQAWMDTLSAPKRHVLSLMLRRSHIMDALDSMLPFPGVWSGLQLGNWAKHLAAHLDPAIISYWAHIKKTWETIMTGNQDLYHLVTADDVARLQYRAPARSKTDRDYIQDAFAKLELFKGIRDADVRSQILNQILSLDCVIPSIRTFHQNMRYVTIGAKILERNIQCVKKSRRKRDSVEPGVSSLFDALRKDWRPIEKQIEVSQGSFVALPGVADSYLAFLVLFFAALRCFPYLSSEKPLLDVDKKDICLQASGGDYLGWLCTVAKQLGFSSPRIEKGCNSSLVHPKATHFKIPSTKRDWRAGTPPVVAYRILERSSFIHRIYGPEVANLRPLDPLFIQSDLLRAFFPYEITMPEGISDEVLLSLENPQNLQPATTSAHNDAVLDPRRPSGDVLTALGSVPVDGDTEMADLVENSHSDTVEEYTARRPVISRPAMATEARRLGRLNHPAHRKLLRQIGAEDNATHGLTQHSASVETAVLFPSTSVNLELPVPEIPEINNSVAPLQMTVDETPPADQRQPAGPKLSQFRFASKVTKRSNQTSNTWKPPETQGILANLAKAPPVGRSVLERIRGRGDNNSDSTAAIPDSLRRDDFPETPFHESQPKYPKKPKKTPVPQAQKRARGIRAQRGNREVIVSNDNLIDSTAHPPGQLGGAIGELPSREPSPISPLEQSTGAAPMNNTAPDSSDTFQEQMEARPATRVTLLRSDSPTDQPQPKRRLSDDRYGKSNSGVDGPRKKVRLHFAPQRSESGSNPEVADFQNMYAMNETSQIGSDQITLPSVNERNSLSPPYVEEEEL